MQIQITEHKSVGKLVPWSNHVRVFVNKDLQYGYFVPEVQLFELLTVEQQQTYLSTEGNVFLDVPAEIAQKIIDIGLTPYHKARVA